ncbi:hypothetical protein RB195_001935 [Necator americanus]|uniref:Guanylate cyclase n=1 Tax=Necator americanus TaxID=51031 RepID=A0ABR1DHE3_NECAM
MVRRFPYFQEHYFKQILIDDVSGFDDTLVTPFRERVEANGMTVDDLDLKNIYGYIHLYDALRLYAIAVRAAMNLTGNESIYQDGRFVWNQMRRITFSGLVSAAGVSSGTVMMDDIAERAPIYARIGPIRARTLLLFSENRALAKTPWRIYRDDFRVVNEDEVRSMLSLGSTRTKLSNQSTFAKHHAVLGTNTHASFHVYPQRRPISFKRDDMQLLTLMKQAIHDNLNPFLGMSFNEKEEMVLLWKFCSRGTVQDIIYNKDMVLDAKFHGAFIRDITLGLEYLHSSPIGYHGSLTPWACLIDRNWMIKLTDYGIANPLERWEKQGLISTEVLKDGDDDGKNQFSQMNLPEEQRMRPSALMTHFVKKKVPQLVILMKCRKGSLVDQMMRMMEQYANNLEKIVQERTGMLEDANARADKLLSQLLPSYVANELKLGRPVPPKTFQSATVMFSDIVGFTTICSSSTPLEVVSMLNAIYSKFDDVINKNQAYKVETIGDAYMVVSGIPEENGTKHIMHIADTALDMMELLKTYEIPHRKNVRLRIRLGFHTGTVAAGVVGLTAPRYCLFGDTVNMASRMESTGEPEKIQMSQCSHEMIEKYYPEYQTQLRGTVQVKGKGECTTYWLLGRSTGLRNGISKRQKSPLSVLTFFAFHQKAAAVARNICVVHGEGVIGVSIAQKCFVDLKNGEFDLDDASRIGISSGFHKESRLKALISPTELGNACEKQWSTRTLNYPPAS